MAKKREELEIRERDLEIEWESFRLARKELHQRGIDEILDFDFEWKQLRFRGKQLEMVGLRLDIQRDLQDIRVEEYDQCEHRGKIMEECLDRQQTLCIRQGVVDENGTFVLSREG